MENRVTHNGDRQLISKVAKAVTLRILIILCLGGLLFLYMKYLEPRWIEVTEKQVPVRGLSQPVTLVHMTDFHFSKYTGIGIIEKTVSLALEQSPDVICLTGDYVRRKVIDWAGYQKQLARLASVPTIAVMGNHDGGQWVAPKGGYRETAEIERLLSEAGIVTLKNSNSLVTIRGQQIRFVGTGDKWAGEVDPVAAFRGVSKQATVPVIALTHNPDSKHYLPEDKWDLMLCGHTHGSQFTIPFTDIRPFLPTDDTKYAEGLFEYGEGYLHVSRGIGGVWGVRFNCRPEVAVLKLTPRPRAP